MPSLLCIICILRSLPLNLQQLRVPQDLPSVRRLDRLHVSLDQTQQSLLQSVIGQSKGSTVKPALVTTCLQGPCFLFPLKKFLIETCTKGTCLQRPLFVFPLGGRCRQGWLYYRSNGSSGHWFSAPTSPRCLSVLRLTIELKKKKNYNTIASQFAWACFCVVIHLFFNLSVWI